MVGYRLASARRRSRSRYVFVLLALMLALISYFGYRRGNNERVRQMWATAAVHDDGSALLSETIDYRFPRRRHGIFRDVPGLSASADVSVRKRSERCRTRVVRTQPDDDLDRQSRQEGVRQSSLRDRLPTTPGHGRPRAQVERRGCWLDRAHPARSHRGSGSLAMDQRELQARHTPTERRLQRVGGRTRPTCRHRR